MRHARKGKKIDVRDIRATSIWTLILAHSMIFVIFLGWRLAAKRVGLGKSGRLIAGRGTQVRKDRASVRVSSWRNRSVVLARGRGEGIGNVARIVAEEGKERIAADRVRN